MGNGQAGMAEGELIFGPARDARIRAMRFLIPQRVTFLMCRVRCWRVVRRSLSELEEKDEFRLTPEKAAGENHTENKGADSSIPEQSNGRDHEPHRSGGDREGD